MRVFETTKIFIFFNLHIFTNKKRLLSIFAFKTFLLTKSSILYFSLIDNSLPLTLLNCLYLVKFLISWRLIFSISLELYSLFAKSFMAFCFMKVSQLLSHQNQV